MSDPVFTPTDFLNAEIVVSHLAQNLAIQFQIEGENFSREQMQKHANKRAALCMVGKMLLDEGERLLKEGA